MLSLRVSPISVGEAVSFPTTRDANSVPYSS
jgi:hypothetical protein